jgi:hypothetical protein
MAVSSQNGTFVRHYSTANGPGLQGKWGGCRMGEKRKNESPLRGMNWLRHEFSLRSMN